MVTGVSIMSKSRGRTKMEYERERAKEEDRRGEI